MMSGNDIVSGSVSMKLQKPDIFGNTWGGAMIAISDRSKETAPSLTMLFPDDEGIFPQTFSDQDVVSGGNSFSLGKVVVVFWLLTNSCSSYETQLCLGGELFEWLLPLVRFFGRWQF
jgi:hypothetical protein